MNSHKLFEIRRSFREFLHPGSDRCAPVVSTEPLSNSQTMTLETKQACATALKTKNVSLAARACRRGDQDYRRGPITKYFGCRNKTRANQHDTLLHCMRTYYTYSGPCSYRCTGRCGAGCGNQNGYGVYTQDCLDHDVCVAHHGYAVAGCQDEFKETWNDVSRGITYYGRSKSCRR